MITMEENRPATIEQVDDLQTVYELLAKKRKTPPNNKQKLFELMDAIQTQTEKNGFTQQKLEKLLNKPY